ncbi:MAG: hypothetical protein U0Z26_19555 [Anaerolineales bacterium]
MEQIVGSLEAKKLPVDKLLLDPNNPRVHAFKTNTPVNKIPETAVQNRALTDIADMGVDEIKDSILQVGFLPIDRIVVVPLKPDSGYYVAIEGNRRLASIKSILKDADEEGLEIPSEILSTLQNINVLVLTNETYAASSSSQLLILGLRHISGVKSWQPYQQAKALVKLTQNNASITDAAKAIGIGRSTASWMQKAYYAFENMRKNEYVELPRDESKASSLFSFFVELLKDSYLRTHFEWSDDKNEFINSNEILKFYEWIGVVKNEDSEGNEKARQISGALEVRKLAAVLQNPDAKRAFEAGDTIVQASLRIEEQIPEQDYSKILRDIESEINNLPSTFVRRMNADDRVLMKKMIELLNEHLSTSRDGTS